MMYSLDEIGLIPAEISTIKHRGDVNPFVQSPFGGNKLPIFVSPMTCLLSAENICQFSRSKVEPILPVISGELDIRTKLPNGSNWLGWIALTLDEFKYHFNGCRATEDRVYHILIDVANGHMKELFDVVKDAKQEYGKDLVVMIGNIANPKTYLECCKARVDYVRVGIGGGTGCTTSVQTGVHTSLPYILEGIKKVKDHISNHERSAEIGMAIYGDPEIKELKGFRTKIIADGGVTTTARAIKCLALGADYVMMGKAFAQCEEASDKVYHGIFSGNVTPMHLYYGQSSEQGQIDRFGKVKANPEGSSTHIPITTNLSEFCDKFEAALRSAMSYCNAKDLSEFIGKVQYEVMSPAEFNAYNK